MSDPNPDFYLRRDPQTGLFNGDVQLRRLVEVAHLKRERLLLLARNFRDVQKQEATK